MERQFTVVGEALAQVRRREPTLASQIPGLAEAVGLRNILVHGYAITDDDLMWNTAIFDAPVLLDVLVALYNDHRDG